MRVTDSNSHYQRLVKPVMQWLFYADGSQSNVFIFGAQRSGTTLLSSLYNELFPCRVFGEFSRLSSDDQQKGIRLNNLDRVKETLASIHAPVAVLKPLVESQHADDILKRIPNSHGVWMYRHYLETSLSDIKKFQATNGLGNLLPILKGERNNWRSENVSKETLENIQSVVTDPYSLSPQEAACLFWYARNRLFFEKNWANQSIVLLNYHRLLDGPDEVFNQLIKTQLGRVDAIKSCLPLKLKTNVSPDINRSGQRDEGNISLPIRALCDELWDELLKSQFNLSVSGDKQSV